MWDINTLLRDVAAGVYTPTDLTLTEDKPVELTINESPVTGLVFKMIIPDGKPTVGGDVDPTGAELDVKIQQKDAGGIWTDVIAFPTIGASDDITTHPGIYEVRAKIDKDIVAAVFTITLTGGTNPTVNYGKVICGIVPETKRFET